jgi:hypothetical protein
VKERLGFENEEAAQFCSDCRTAWPAAVARWEEMMQEWRDLFKGMKTTAEQLETFADFEFEYAELYRRVMKETTTGPENRSLEMLQQELLGLIREGGERIYALFAEEKEEFEDGEEESEG